MLRGMIDAEGTRIARRDARAVRIYRPVGVWATGVILNPVVHFSWQLPSAAFPLGLFSLSYSIFVSFSVPSVPLWLAVFS